MIEKGKAPVVFEINEGSIQTENGLPYGPRWFCDNRLAFEAYEYELGDVQFFSSWGKGQRYGLFRKQFWGGLRLYLFDREHRYILKAEQCEIWPFGYFSRTKIEGVSVSYGIYTCRDSLYFCVELPEQFEGYSFGLEFYDDYRVMPSPDYNDLRYRDNRRREWSEWQRKDGCIVCQYTEADSVTGVSFVGNLPLEYTYTLNNTKRKISMSGLVSGQCHTICMNLERSIEDSVKKGRNAIRTAKRDREAMKERYEKAAKRSPVLHSGNEALDNFFALAPVYHESLKITEIPGGLRAKTTMYWMWGWDTMTSAACIGYWGDREFLDQMAECLMTYSNKEGIPHAFGLDMQGSEAAPPAAQGIYIVLLNLLLTHGLRVDRYYDFAKRLFTMIMDTEYQNMGLCSGTSLVPDYRELVGENGRDISTFNNSIAYCAARSMVLVSDSVGDTQMKEKAAAFAERLRRNFPILYNESLGFFDSSVEEGSFTCRNVPSNNSFKWENDFAEDLVADYAENCADFYEKNLICAGGIRPYLIDSAAYDQDANQLSAWWPNVTELFCRVANLTDRPQLLEQWLAALTPWMEKLSFPEGVTCYVDNPLFVNDNWNAQSGT
ncbi:MAG: hypothetical protein J6B85_01190, partial [Lachnospiraceae bacterium]|nr:hypothetical protein [Lachnospiraceae bacterium]